MFQTEDSFKLLFIETKILKSKASFPLDFQNPPGYSLILCVRDENIESTANQYL